VKAAIEEESDTIGAVLENQAFGYSTVVDSMFLATAFMTAFPDDKCKR
jgi:hypothetical protein